MIGQASFPAQLADHPLNLDVFLELGGMSDSRSCFVRDYGEFWGLQCFTPSVHFTRKPLF